MLTPEAQEAIGFDTDDDMQEYQEFVQDHQELSMANQEAEEEFVVTQQHPTDNPKLNLPNTSLVYVGDGYAFGYDVDSDLDRKNVDVYDAHQAAQDHAKKRNFWYAI